MANSVSQSSLLESFESKIKVEPGPTTQSDVLIKNSGSLPEIGVFAFSLLWSL
mgnify:CR=1 FL=1